jgi:hypothetical protein
LYTQKRHSFWSVITAASDRERLQLDYVTYKSRREMIGQTDRPTFSRSLDRILRSDKLSGKYHLVCKHSLLISHFSGNETAKYGDNKQWQLPNNCLHVLIYDGARLNRHMFRTGLYGTDSNVLSFRRHFSELDDTLECKYRITQRNWTLQLIYSTHKSEVAQSASMRKNNKWLLYRETTALFDRIKNST